MPSGANESGDTPAGLDKAGCGQPNRNDFLGAVHAAGVTRFRVWAPHAQRVEVLLERPNVQSFALERSEDGYFIGEFSGTPPGSLYKYSVDGQNAWPDPCSRYQPSGPHGPSAVVDPTSYRWQDSPWHGAKLERQVIYELHIGAFTADGTFEAAANRLEHLRDVGITMIELLPVSECPGRWNWGYDGVQLYAPYHVYGEPDDFKRFIDRAHALGIAVILDVVYNHLGPDGNYLKCYSPRYLSQRYHTEWGEALNFDEEHCFGARDFVINNAKYWLREFHIDGFRLDATQSMFDTSEPHVIAQLVAECRASTERDIVFIAENEPQRGEQLLPHAQGGFDLDAMWNDDFHHAMRVALTGSRDGYFRDYAGRAQELLSAIKHGFLFQGQYYYWQNKRRGSPLRGSPRNACVHFLQNHDQVGNTNVGDRVHTYVSPRRYRAATAVLLLGPQTPLLFMGQEFLASSRFMFFADHKPELRKLVHQGRREFLSQFQAYATEAVQAAIRDPGEERTFLESKLDWSEVERSAPALFFHKDLLRLRRDDSVLSQAAELPLDGATLNEYAFVVRWFAPDEGDRLLVVNLDRELMMQPAPEPLLAPPRDRTWQTLWSSEDPSYGGLGVIEPVSNEGRWRVPAECAVLLRAQPG
jgi:maltooligosyltrehalose trehalohydrolase